MANMIRSTLDSTLDWHRPMANMIRSTMDSMLDSTLTPPNGKHDAGPPWTPPLLSSNAVEGAVHIAVQFAIGWCQNCPGCSPGCSPKWSCLPLAGVRVLSRVPWTAGEIGWCQNCPGCSPKCSPGYSGSCLRLGGVRVLFAWICRLMFAPGWLDVLCILSTASGNWQHVRASIALSTPLTRFKFQTKMGLCEGQGKQSGTRIQRFNFYLGLCWCIFFCLFGYPVRRAVLAGGVSVLSTNGTCGVARWFVMVKYVRRLVH